MSNPRLIARLDVKGPNLIKGIHLEGLRVIGDPQEHARRYYEQGADELIYIDIVASLYGRNSLGEIVSRSARDVFVPLTVGGGLRSIEDVRDMLRAGADKVGVNTAGIARPELLHEISRRFGSQVIVLSVDARRAPGPPSGFEVTTHGGRRGTGIDAVAWAKEAADRGVGEILLNSIDADGTKEGFDLELLAAVRAVATTPVIASGGAGGPAHFAPAVAAGADAVLAASIFHSGQCTIGDVKAAMREAGVTVR